MYNVYNVSVCPSVRLSHAGIVSKRLDESSWYLAWMLPSTYPTLCHKNIRLSPNQGYFPVELCPKLYVRKFCDCKSIVFSSKFIDDRACWPRSRRGWTHIVHYAFVGRFVGGFVVRLVPTVAQRLARFRLTSHSASHGSVCGWWASCYLC